MIHRTRPCPLIFFAVYGFAWNEKREKRKKNVFMGSFSAWCDEKI